MECPRCQTTFDPPTCPQCGWIKSPRERRPENGSTLSVGTVGAADPLRSSSDWRRELREKVQRHKHHKLTGRVQTASRTHRDGTSSADKSLPSIEEPAGSALPAPGYESSSAPTRPHSNLSGGKLGRQILAIQPDQPEPLPNKKIVTLKTPSPTRVPQKPLIRRLPGVRVRTIPGKGPHQKSLRLDPDRAETAAERGGMSPGALAGKSGKEILFSRFLAGIIDLVLAGAAGLAFAFAAARLLGVHFPTPEFLLLAAGCGFSVFFLDSVFFLALVQQTPGMMWTSIKVVPTRGEQLSVVRVIVRIVAFVPAFLSLLGLSWSALDSEHRCLHDLLSGTRVVVQPRN